MRAEQFQPAQVFAPHLRAGLHLLQAHFRLGVAQRNNQILDQLELPFRDRVGGALADQVETHQRYGTLAPGARKALPQFFSDEGHEGMKQVERGFKNSRQVDPGRRNFRAVVAARNFRLDPFQIPVANVVPEKMIDLVSRFVEAIIGEGFLHFPAHSLQTRENPAVGQRQRFQ